MTKVVGSPGEFEEKHQEHSSGEGNGAIALAHALDVSDEPVYIYDTKGKCQWVNRSGEKLLHLDARQIIGRYIFELFPGQSRFQIKAWRRVIDAKEPSSFVSETTIDGDTYKFQTSIFPVMDYGDRVQSVVSVGRPFADREVLQYQNEMRGAELDLIHEISSIVTSSLEIGHVYERFAEEFRKLVDFDRIVIMELDETEEHAIPTFVSHTGTFDPMPQGSYTLARTGMRWVLEHQSTHIENDLCERREVEIDEVLLEKGIRSVMRVPLVTRTGTIGMMALGSYHPNMFGDREQTLAERVASQIAPAIENARLYQEAQEYAKELEVIDEIASIVTSSLRIEEVYERFASGVRRLVDFDRISIILVGEDSSTATQEYVSDTGTINLESMNTVSLEDSPAGWMINHRATLVEADLSESMEYEFDRAFLDAGIRSIIRVPFISKEHAIGGFALNSREPRAFGPRERRVLERLAAQIAPAIENARLYQEAQERARELQVIDDIATIMTSNLHIEEVYERFASEVKRLVDFDRMSVILADEMAGQAVVTYIAGARPDSLKSLIQWPIEDTHVQWVINHRESLLESDLQAPGGCSFPEDEPLLQAGFRSGIRVPLLNKERIIGTFTLWSFKPNSYGPRELRIVERLAAQIEPAIENARLYEEIEQALETVNATQEQLVRVERLRAMGELASGVAHDLNNALAAILGRTQLLINQVENETHRKSLYLVEQAAQDSAQVVKRILDFARLEADSEFSNIDVNSLVEDVVELTRHKWSDEAQSKGQVIEINTSIGEVWPVLGNYSEMREVLMNLVINAYESIQGDGTIELSTSRSSQHVYIAVSDTGMGMSPEVKQKVFDPFFTTKGSKGTGLGLSITLGIITRHNGTVEVDSEEGEGTTVRIVLPIAEEIEDTVEDAAAVSSEVPLTASILVIEDELLIRETLSDMLDLGGHQVALAVNGEEGISMFQQGDYDIVFTDLGMPGLSGWDVAKAIRKQCGDVPIVMVTGWGVGLDRSEMAESGVDEVLPKPFDIDIVLGLVQRLMERHRESL